VLCSHDFLSGVGSGVVSEILNLINISDTTPDPDPDPDIKCSHDGTCPADRRVNTTLVLYLLNVFVTCVPLHQEHYHILDYRPIGDMQYKIAYALLLNWLHVISASFSTHLSRCLTTSWFVYKYKYKYDDWFSAPPTNRTATHWNVRHTKKRYNRNSLRVKVVCKCREIKHFMPSGTKKFSESTCIHSWSLQNREYSWLYYCSDNCYFNHSLESRLL